MNPTVDNFGNKCWYNSKRLLHRLDGPAIERVNGTKAWLVDGKHHRLDGPAIEWADGYREWYVNGKFYSKTEFNKLFGKYKNLEDRQVIADMEGMFK